MDVIAEVEDLVEDQVRLEEEAQALREWTHALYRHLVRSEGRVKTRDLPPPPGWSGEVWGGEG